VLPTVVEPLRADWANAQAAAVLLASEAAGLTGKPHDDKMAQARAELKQFHHQLCTLKVLDPACGSGNFLYVTLVLQAYGLEAGLSNDALLTHLVTLNAQRAAEEKAGKVRWLRPEFQNPAFKANSNLLLNQELLSPVSIGLQANLIPENDPKTEKNGKNGSKVSPNPWPGTLPAQVSAIAQLLASTGASMSLGDIEASFKGKGPWKKGLPRILETLEALGRARREGEGWRGL